MNNWELKIGRRKINFSEREKFNRYFKPSRRDSVIINSGADIPTTIAQIKNIVAETLEQTRQVAKELGKSGDVNEVAAKIHAFLWQCFDYDEEEVGAHLPPDSRDELLREPCRIWEDMKGDCDCFTIIVSSILTNLGIKHALRIAKYEYTDDYGQKKIGEWQHIYVVIPTYNSQYITIDGVLSQFDREYPFYQVQDFPMATIRLGNLPQKADSDQVSKDTLKSILDMVTENPSEAENYGYTNVDNLKKMLNYALSHWDTNRDEVLSVLAQEEANMNTLNGTGGLGNIWEDVDIQDEIQYLHGFGALLKKKAKVVKVKTPPKKQLIKTKSSAPGQAKPKPTVKKNLFQKVKDKVTGGDGKFELKDAAHLYKKTPLAPARLVILLAVKANIMKLKDDLKKNPAKYEKFEKAWFSFGGEKNIIHDAVHGKGNAVNGLLGSLGVVGVDDAAVAAAGAAPAAGFLASNSDLFKKINLKDILAMLKSLFKKDKDKKEETEGNPNAKGEKPEFHAPMAITEGEETNTGGGGAGTEVARKTGPIYDKDNDGKDDESGLVYQDDGTGHDVATGREIIKGKGQNFFLANPLITAGIVTALGVGGWWIWKLVTEKMHKPDGNLQGLPPKKKKVENSDKERPRRLPVMA